MFCLTIRRDYKGRIFALERDPETNDNPMTRLMGDIGEFDFF